jgi:hypothetical protein
LTFGNQTRRLVWFFQNNKTSIFAFVSKQMLRVLTSISLPFLLVFAFSAMPTAAAFACGKGADCCKKEVKKEGKTCCEAHGDHSKKDDCGGDCGKKGCPCPHPAPNAPSALPADHFQIPARLPLAETRSKADWYFLNKIPAAVYLSLWLPPKI